MSPAVAVRRAADKRAHLAVSAPASFVVVASRVVNQDHVEIVLRGEHVGTFAGARRHALRLLEVAAARFGAASVDVLDSQNVPVFAASAGGAL